MRLKIKTGEIYHVYNRGNDKRKIFMNQRDIDRFLLSMREFNEIEPVGSIYHKNQNRNRRHPISPIKLVNIMAYCLNPNHYHFLVEQNIDGGLSEFMKRLGIGYTKYFNEEYDRSGALFQGKYKYIQVEDAEYLKYLSVYVNLNDKIHQYKNWDSVSSHAQYIKEERRKNTYWVENKQKILSMFESTKEFKEFAEKLLPEIVLKKEEI